METEYQVRYPQWIEGQGEYTANHEKQKLLAYASKCHTPIFGEAAPGSDRMNLSRGARSLERVTHSPLLRDLKKQQSRKSNSKSRTAAKKRPQSVPPRKRKPLIAREIRCVPGVKRKTRISLSLSTSHYLKLLCNIDNVRPAPKGIANFGN